MISQRFIEGIAMLLFTAAVTGFLVPYLLRKTDERKLLQQREVDARKLREQKAFEASLARQAKVIEAQVLLLEKLSELLWQYQLMAIEITYYHGQSDQKLYEAAYDRYHANAGALLGRIRAEISKALRLASRATYDALKRLYYDELLKLDQRLTQLTEGKANNWLEVNRFSVYELSEIVDGTLNALATELQLKEEAAPA
jgi:hypothetical protein